MKSEQAREKMSVMFRMVCAGALAVALLPVACSYILDGGIIREWIARVEELAAGMGGLYVYPSAEVFAATGIWQNAMNSNLWFLISGVLYGLTGDIVSTYRIFMLFLQLGTFLTAVLFFRRAFNESRTDIAPLLGVALYLCCPYRIYICYDAANLSQAVAWMLLPLYAWALLGIFREKRWMDVAVAALVLAGLGYADALFFVVLVVITLALGVIGRRPGSLAGVAGGCILFLPGLWRLGQYLFSGGFAELELPVFFGQSGYHLGEYLGSYSYREGRPGLGIGMLMGLAAFVWSRFVEHKKSKHNRREGVAFLALSGLFFALSLAVFPWDMLRGLGEWAAKLVSLMETPAVFAGMAFFCLCIPAVKGAEEMQSQEDRVIAAAIPLIMLLFCMGLCVYQCNMLTYNRLPLFLQ